MLASAALLPADQIPLATLAWLPGEHAPPAATNTDGTLFPCPFPDGVLRLVWDADLSLDLDKYDGVEFNYTCEQPAAFKGITFYLRSGAGWFAASLPVRDGAIRHWVPRADFTRQDQPDGWDRIAGMRLSPWSAARGPGGLLLESATPRRAAVALARPGEQSLPQPQERAFGIQATGWLGHQLDQMGVPYALLTDEDLADADIPERYRALFLPYHPNITAPALRRLKNFLHGGGRLYVAYNSNRDLAELMGIQAGAFVSGRAGEYYAMGFVPGPEWRGPLQVFQGLPPNLLTITPASRDTKVLAWWLDDRGRRQAEAACLQSPQGVWFSHILSADDDAAQRKMLAALLDEAVPGLFTEAVQRRLADIDTELINLTAAAADIDTAGMRGIWVGTEMLAGNLSVLAAGLAQAGFSDVFLNVPRTSDIPGDFTAFAAKNNINTHLWHICWNLDGLPAKDLAELKTAGRLQQSADGGITHWLCPAQRANQMLELQRLLELAAQAGIAGIHLDYIRYPDDRHCFCPSCRKNFEEATGQPVESWPASVLTGPDANRFREWRAHQITDFVAEFSRQLRTHHSSLKLSAAVFPNYPECRDTLGQDWGRWLKDNLLDFVCPMNYTSNTGEFAAWFQAQTELPGAHGRVIPGIGATSDQSRLSPMTVVRQIMTAATIDKTGFVIYKLTHGLNKELLPALGNALQSKPADND